MAYSIASHKLLYKITVLKEAAMIRIVCPFCHTPLGSHELETAIMGGNICLVCPECEHILLTEERGGGELPQVNPLVVHVV